MSDIKILIFDPDLLSVVQEEIRTGRREEDFLNSELIKIVDDLEEVKKYLNETTILLVHISWIPGGVKWIRKNLLKIQPDLKVIIYTGGGFYEKLPAWCKFCDIGRYFAYQSGRSLPS